MNADERQMMDREKKRRRYGGIPLLFLFSFAALAFLSAELGWISEAHSRFLTSCWIVLLPIAIAFTSIIDGKFRFVRKRRTTLITRNAAPLRYWGLVTFLVLWGVVIALLLLTRNTTGP